MDKSTAIEVVASATICTGRNFMISPGIDCNDERDLKGKQNFKFDYKSITPRLHS
jgi:hypothetical protein